MIDRDEDEIGAAQRLVARLGVEEGMVQVDVGALGEQELLQLERQRVADIVDVLLEGEAEDRRLGAVDRGLQRACSIRYAGVVSWIFQALAMSSL